MKTLVFTRLRFGVAQRREKSTKYFSRKQAEKSTLGGRYPAAGIILQVIISGKEDFFYEITAAGIILQVIISGKEDFFYEIISGKEDFFYEIVFEKLRLDNT